MKDLHSPVSIQGERDLSQDTQVAVDKFAQALVIFDCSPPRTPTDEQLKPRDTKCILNINPNQKNLEPVAGSWGDLELLDPLCRLSGALLVRNTPYLPYGRWIVVRR